MRRQVAPVPGARFGPPFLEAVAAWAAVQQQRRLSPAQRLRLPPPPPPAAPPLQPPKATPSQQPAMLAPADADTGVTAGSEGDTAGEAGARSSPKPSCSEAVASASVGSAASIVSQQAAEAAEGSVRNLADEAVPAPGDTADGAPWEDYSSAAWIAEALTGLQVGDDAQRGPQAGPAAEAIVRAPVGSSSVEAAGSVRGSSARPSTSGDDSDEVTSPLTGLPGQDAAGPWLRQLSLVNTTQSVSCSVSLYPSITRRFARMVHFMSSDGFG